MSLQQEIWKYVKLILIGIVAGLILRFVLQICVVSGLSMYPTLEDADTFIGINRIFTILERGDIVTVDMSAKGYGTNDLLVKRIIAIPGDHIKIVNHDVYLNDELLKENYINENYDYQVTGVIDYKLKDDQYFVMGDNRGNSTDSRFFGPVNKNDILLEYLFPLF